MIEKPPKPEKPAEQLHFRINQFEVLASGRFTVVAVLGAILLAIIVTLHAKFPYRYLA
ncbi:hypothetical protein FIV00_26780 [Labrenzia sp. THAF82]|uniref:hypothetical protein n=1 Tax=Labrenzia sp. THAF82 TaxID=2587861 RepID=UPI0012AAA86E|nr:hypothetical protein [Labrenzia sp. THAF82]QFT34130.1 hypothetical protein FIV00_26780 [Labrenzia sp. THAF82]